MRDEKKIYLIKKITPWMVEELISFSKNTSFKVILLKDYDKFYEEDLKRLRESGIPILVKPFGKIFDVGKIFFSIKFIFKHLNKITLDYNTIILIKSIIWFVLLDKELFGNSSVTIHAQFTTQASLVSLLLKEYYGERVKYHITFHAYDIFFGNRWFTEIVNKSEKSFSISKYNLEYVKSNYKDTNSSKIKISRLGVKKRETKKIDLSDINQKKKDYFTIGFLSWFVEKKGIFYLLEAVKRISNRNLKIKLLLAGGGPLKHKILDYIRSNNLSSEVEYLGIVKGEDKHAFFRSIDAFVLPSIKLENDKDGIPVVLMEAISYGLPLISTNISGIPEICKKDYNGILIPEKDIRSIFDSIRFLQQNKEAYRRYSENALKVFEEYDINKNAYKKLEMMGWINE